MGISGHMLGERKLRKLNAMFPDIGPFDRAYNRNGEGAARIIDERGECLHFWVDYRNQQIAMIEFPTHWTSCPKTTKGH